jgi:hypothetical protein
LEGSRFVAVRNDQIFCGYDLPAAISLYPGVRPYKTPVPWLIISADPGLDTLSHSRVTKESHLHLIHSVGQKVLGSLSYVSEHSGFVIEVPFWINSDEILSQNARGGCCVTGGD